MANINYILQHKRQISGSFDYLFLRFENRLVYRPLQLPFSKIKKLC